MAILTRKGTNWAKGLSVCVQLLEENLNINGNLLSRTPLAGLCIGIGFNDLSERIKAIAGLNDMYVNIPVDASHIRTYANKAHTCLYIGLYGRMYLGRMHMCISDCNACRMCGWVGGSFTIASRQSRRRWRQRQRQHPSSRWTDPRRATCAHSSEFAFQFECQDDGASNLGGGVGGIEMKINHVALPAVPGTNRAAAPKHSHH